MVWPQNHWDGFLRFDLKTGNDDFLWFDLKTGGDSFSRFDLKIGGSGFPVWASKPVVTVFNDLASKLVAQVFRFGHQNWQLRFIDLRLKITAVVSWFVTQNQAKFDLSDAP
jgi:hypothetical protein